MDGLKAHLRRWWLAHAAVIGALVLSLLTMLGTFASQAAQQWVNVKVGGPHGTPVQTIEVPVAAVNASRAGLDDHEGSRDETPAGAPHAAIEAAREQQDALAANDQLPIVTPLAAPEQRGCVTRLVQNYSTRRGVRPRIFVLHYTVSPNRPGWSDVNGIVSLFDRPAFAASSNYVIDAEGHCAYIVRESDKAWTQAALNPVSISVEAINTGHETSYLGMAGLSKLALVVSDALKRWEIPVQLGEVRGGVVVRPGIVDHGMLGVVGGGHHDIAPYSVRQVIAAVERVRAAETPKPAPKSKRHPKPKPLRVCTVKQEQAALNRRGARLAVDGIKGPKTRAALARVGFARLGLHCRAV
jgi:hypothetical protein